MDWIRHFPTFHKQYHGIAKWYLERDIFEKVAINAIAWSGVAYLIFVFLFSAPAGYPSGAYVEVTSGASLRAVAGAFKDRGVVNDAHVFEIVTRALGGNKHIKAGYYFFSREENMIWVAMRLIAGDFETSAIRVTIPEGTTVGGIAKILLEKVPEFNSRKFVSRAQEGYMFPDTYFFRPGESTEAILSVFDNTFHNRINKIQKEITASGRTLAELLTMASILEKEASKTKDRQQIAGVLWYRIKIGMPLQVDAVFPYILGKNTFELTREDLQFDSPYNTYKYKGLPPGPINNPGIDSILAAATPVKSKYVYFLSDKSGNFHYAVTYAQHLANKRKYLD